MLGRFIRVTDYGQVEKQKEVTGEVKQEQSKKRLEQNKIINKHVGLFQKAGGEESEIDKYALDAAREAFKGQIITKDEDRRFKKKFRVSALRGQNDPKISGLIYANTIDEQLALLGAYRKDMSLDEFKELFEFAQNEKLISTDTARKFLESRKVVE